MGTLKHEQYSRQSAVTLQPSMIYVLPALSMPQSCCLAQYAGVFMHMGLARSLVDAYGALQSISTVLSSSILAHEHTS